MDRLLLKKCAPLSPKASQGRGGWLAFALIPLVFFLWSSSAPAQTPGLPIKNIEIQGNRRVEEGTIRFYVSTRVGDRFSVSKLRKDIKKIYDLGFFRDVKIDVTPFEGGLRIVFIVEEKPSVAGVRIVGNKEVDLEDILRAGAAQRPLRRKRST